MSSGAPFPAAASVTSINAYLGAFPIAKALDLDADVVITGRCVDSALVLGPLIHRLGEKQMKSFDSIFSKQLRDLLSKSIWREDFFMFTKGSDGKKTIWIYWRPEV